LLAVILKTQRGRLGRKRTRFGGKNLLQVLQQKMQSLGWECLSLEATNNPGGDCQKVTSGLYSYPPKQRGRASQILGEYRIKACLELPAPANGGEPSSRRVNLLIIKIKKRGRFARELNSQGGSSKKKKKAIYTRRRIVSKG